MSVPKDYTSEHVENNLTGTDMYLTVVTAVLTAAMVKTCVTLFLFANDYTINATVVQIVTAICSLLAARNCLTMQNDTMFRRRVFTSMTEAVKTAFVGPFTLWAQIGRSTTQGFSFTRNLFD